MILAGDSGLFRPRGVVSFPEVSARLGALAVTVALLSVGGEFDLSLGSRVAFSDAVIAIHSRQYGWVNRLCIFTARAATIQTSQAPA